VTIAKGQRSLRPGSNYHHLMLSIVAVYTSVLLGTTLGSKVDILRCCAAFVEQRSLPPNCAVSAPSADVDCVRLRPKRISADCSRLLSAITAETLDHRCTVLTYSPHPPPLRSQSLDHWVLARRSFRSTRRDHRSSQRAWVDAISGGQIGVVFFSGRDVSWQQMEHLTERGTR